MKVLMAAGGTAGHINPAIAIADYIKNQNDNLEIIFAGTQNGMEADLVQRAGYQFVPIKVHGFQRSLTPKNILRNTSAAFRLVTSSMTAEKIMKRLQPDLVIGTGGYVSGPVVRKAAQMGIRTAIHEQNAFPGMTNKMLSKQVDVVFLAVKEAENYLPQGRAKVVVVGNPIRQKVLFCGKTEARQKLHLDDAFCILSFGGSLGASKINEIAADLMQWHALSGNVNHIHATGKVGAAGFAKLLEERHVTLKDHPRIDVRTYIDDMDTCLAAADLVICRAGAITLSELEATGKASILVPSPYVAENHQYHNAMVLQNHGAAVVIEEKNYDKKALIAAVETFYQDPKKRKEYSKNASALAILDTCETIYQTLFSQEALNE